MAGGSIRQKKEVGGEARPVASTDPGDFMGQWKDLDTAFVFTVQRHWLLLSVRWEASGGFEQGRGRRAEVEAESVDGRQWQWSRKKWCGLGDGSRGAGSDWFLAVLQDGTDRTCHAVGLPALYLQRRQSRKSPS